jgi:hypothetical protein
MLYIIPGPQAFVELSGYVLYPHMHRRVDPNSPIRITLPVIKSITPLGDVKMETKEVLLSTDHHDYDGSYQEKCVPLVQACSFLLSLELMTLEKTQKMCHLDDLLYAFCTSWGFNRWDYRSKWYIKDFDNLVDEENSVDEEVESVES